MLQREVVQCDQVGLQVVDRDTWAEEPLRYAHIFRNLNLPAVQVNGNEAVDAHRFEEAGHIGGRDGHPRGGLPVLG